VWDQAVPVVVIFGGAVEEEERWAGAGGDVVEADVVDAGHVVLDGGAIVVECFGHFDALSLSYQTVDCCCTFTR
jgi:hypothetical protein